MKKATPNTMRTIEMSDVPPFTRKIRVLIITCKNFTFIQNKKKFKGSDQIKLSYKTQEIQANEYRGGAVMGTIICHLVYCIETSFTLNSIP